MTIEDLDIDGSQAGSNADGLDVEANGIAIAGLGITGFSATGVVVFGDQTSITSSTITGNSGAIDIFGASNNTIGGAGAGEGNVISGSAGDGIYAVGAGTSDNLIEGNLIGTDASGTGALANGLCGIYFGDAGAGNTIGGLAAGVGNVISGNGQDGIELTGQGTTGTVITGNRIGTNASGTGAIPNSFGGLLITDRATAVLGSGNTIAGTVLINDGASVDLTGSSNRISGTAWLSLGGGSSAAPARSMSPAPRTRSPAACTSTTAC